MRKTITNFPKFSKVTSTKLKYHRDLFWAMGRLKRPEIKYVWQIGHDKANDKLFQPVHGDQDQFEVSHGPWAAYFPVSLGLGYDIVTL